MASREKTQTILVAEDESVLQFTIVKQLQRLGYRAEVVENGSLALQAVSQKEYALILMDVHMPVMTGLEAARAISEYEKQAVLPRTNIIAMTADPNLEKCLAAGMRGYLMKPITLSQLELVLRKYARSLQTLIPTNRGKNG